MKVRLANRKDCPKVAKIHFQEIKFGFLNQLGEKFLGYFYKAMVNSSNAFLVVVEDNESIIGFISGSTNLNKFYKEFVKKYALRSFFIFLKRIFNVSIFKKAFETMKYSRKEEGMPQAELLSIAVSKEFHGKGVAQTLLERFISEMKTRGVDKLKVVVGESLVGANRFYKKSGFEFHSKNYVHKDKPSNIYIYKIK